jgi:hypothetical protein
MFKPRQVPFLKALTIMWFDFRGEGQKYNSILRQSFESTYLFKFAFLLQCYSLFC